MRELKEAMKAFAVEKSWTDVRAAWLTNSVRGRWRGLRAWLRCDWPHQGGTWGKAYPGVVKVEIRVGGRSFAIRPRGGGTVWGRPLRILGPPLLDPEEIPGAREFYVSAFDVETMRRLFADPRAVSILERSQATVTTVDRKLAIEHSVPPIDEQQATMMTRQQQNTAWVSNALGTIRAIWEVASTVAEHVKR